MAELKVGDRVRVLVGTPDGQPVDGEVAIIQDVVGKGVGIKFDNYVATGHSLDGKLEDKEKTDPETGVTYGRGWWVLSDNVEVLSTEA